MAIVGLAVEQGADPDGDFDACAALASDALAAELLAVTGVDRRSHRMLPRDQFIGEADLSFELRNVMLLVMQHHCCLLLLLQAVRKRHLAVATLHFYCFSGDFFLSRKAVQEKVLFFCLLMYSFLRS